MPESNTNNTTETATQQDFATKSEKPNNVVEFPNSKPKRYNLALGVLPVTPVSFQGKDALVAYGRVLGYGTLAYLTFKKNKNLSYIFMGATALSLATSLAGQSWNNKEK